MSIASGTIAFYYQENFGGTPDTYKVGDSRTFQYQDQWNDKYLSLRVGASAKVSAWQDSDGGGKHIDYTTGEYPTSGADIGGLSKFQVLDDDTTFAIDVRLKDATGKPDGAYTLEIKAADVGDVKTTSNDENYTQVGTSASTLAITTAIYVQEIAWPGATVANGSVYFQWDPSATKITATQTEGFPTNMSLTQDDRTAFTFTLNSVPDA